MVAISFKVRKALKPLVEVLNFLTDVYNKVKYDPKIPNITEEFKLRLKQVVEEKFFNLLFALTKIICEGT